MPPNRDDRGRLLRGHSLAGPGRPPAATERSYLAGVRDAVTMADWRRIVEVAVRQAMEGDPVARLWITNTLLGRNPPALSRLADEPAEQSP